MNPFKILHVTPDAGASDIMQAAARALREKRYSSREIAEARQLLMDPANRPILAFLYTVDLAPLLCSSTPTTTPFNLEELRRLEIFDSTSCISRTAV